MQHGGSVDCGATPSALTAIRRTALKESESPGPLRHRTRQNIPSPGSPMPPNSLGGIRSGVRGYSGQTRRPTLHDAGVSAVQALSAAGRYSSWSPVMIQSGSGPWSPIGTPDVEGLNSSHAANQHTDTVTIAPPPSAIAPRRTCNRAAWNSMVHQHSGCPPNLCA